MMNQRLSTCAFWMLEFCSFSPIHFAFKEVWWYYHLWKLFVYNVNIIFCLYFVEMANFFERKWNAKKVMRSECSFNWTKSLLLFRSPKHLCFLLTQYAINNEHILFCISAIRSRFTGPKIHFHHNLFMNLRNNRRNWVCFENRSVESLKCMLTHI